MAVVVTVGEILVEIMTKKTGQGFLWPGDLIGPYPSGAPAIFIDQVARMGINCGIIARVGPDDFGLLNINRLKGDGVDMSRALYTSGYTTGTAFVTYFDNGDRKFIFHFPHSAAGKLSPEDIDEEYISKAGYLHIMGCSLTASESMRAAIEKAVEVAASNGVTVSFDPNIRPELLEDREIRKVFNSILDTTNILLSGENEMTMFTGCLDVKDAVLQMKARGISLIVLKNGSKGTKVYNNDEYYFIPAFRVEEIDPTGAGDCFDGAFIAAIVEGKSIKEAAELANAAGALSVTKKGPMEGVHYKKEIIDFLSSNREKL